MVDVQEPAVGPDLGVENVGRLFGPFDLGDQAGPLGDSQGSVGGFEGCFLSRQFSCLSGEAGTAEQGGVMGVAIGGVVLVEDLLPRP